MPRKKPYTNYFCKDCEIDFMVMESTKLKVYCPHCGDGFMVDMVGTVWMEKGFNYKRPWTPVEDQIILDGKNAGYSSQEISECLKYRKPKSVNNRYSRLMKMGVYK